MTGHYSIQVILAQTLNNVIRQTRPLLDLVGHAPKPTGVRFNSLAELARFATDAGTPPPPKIKSAC